MVAPMDIELVVEERYIMENDSRYKVRVRGTSIVVNVSAIDDSEAIEKARRLLERTKLVDILRKDG